MKNYTKIAAASTNGANIAAAASVVRSIKCENTTSAKRYVKIYDKATAPTVGTDVPVLTLPVPAKGRIDIDFKQPMQFANGIGIAMTANAVYTDTTAVAASALQVDMKYN